MMLFRKTKQHLEAHAENWRAPRTQEGQNISTVEVVYFVGALMVAMLLVSVLPRTAGVQLIVFGAAVVALSRQARTHVVPAIYDKVAPKFGWKPFREAIALELNAIHAARAGKAGPVAESQERSEPVPVVAPPSSAPRAEAGECDRILQIYAGLPKDDRRSRALVVVERLKQLGTNLTVLEGIEDEAERRIVADNLLLDLARRKPKAAA